MAARETLAEIIGWAGAAEREPALHHTIIALALKYGDGKPVKLSKRDLAAANGYLAGLEDLASGVRKITLKQKDQT